MFIVCREVDDLKQAIAERDAAEEVRVNTSDGCWLFCFSIVPKKTLESLPLTLLHLGGASFEANSQCSCPDHRTLSSKGKCDLPLWNS